MHIMSNVSGYGVFGILKNGPGRTILLRADTDALPVEEQTGLSYASKKLEVDVEGQIEKPVMHACVRCSAAMVAARDSCRERRGFAWSLL
jgi:metal-dependent amidase/aminoacylase/carboxypeptidase family protein